MWPSKSPFVSIPLSFCLFFLFFLEAPVERAYIYSNIMQRRVYRTCIAVFKWVLSFLLRAQGARQEDVSERER